MKTIISYKEIEMFEMTDGIMNRVEAILDSVYKFLLIVSIVSGCMSMSIKIDMLGVKDYFNDYLHEIVIIFLLSLFFVIIIKLIKKRLKKIRYLPIIRYTNTPPESRYDGIFKYATIKWRIFVPDRSLLSSLERINSIEVQPVCPNCETPLKDSPSF
jgi:hypothetical protein